jgi:FkbM family methyltransferase
MGVFSKQMMKGLIKSIFDHLGYRIITKRFIGHNIWDDVELISHEWFAVPIKTIFDVGANNGKTSLELLKRFHPRQVYAFEPVAETFNKLHENTASEGAIKIYKLALSNSSGQAMINRYRGDTLASLCCASPIMNIDNKDYIGPEEVSLMTLDNFCAEEGVASIDLLKIDTEGHDFHVLSGGLKMLSEQKVKFIVFEFYSVGSSDGDEGSLGPIDDLLTSNGYRFISSYADFVNPTVPVGIYNALYALNPGAS